MVLHEVLPLTWETYLPQITTSMYRHSLRQALEEGEGSEDPTDTGRREERVEPFVDGGMKVQPLHRHSAPHQPSSSPGRTGQQPWQAVVGTASLAGAWRPSFSHRRRGSASMA